MLCPKCKKAIMQKEVVVHDYHDPSDRNGHGQQSQPVLMCPKCDHIEADLEDY